MYRGSKDGWSKGQLRKLTGQQMIQPEGETRLDTRTYTPCGASVQAPAPQVVD